MFFEGYVYFTGLKNILAKRYAHGLAIKNSECKLVHKIFQKLKVSQISTFKLKSIFYAMLKSYQKGYEIKVNHLYALHAMSTQYVPMYSNSL